MEFSDQLAPNIANATFRLDGGFATPEAQQRFEAAVIALGGLIGAEVSIDYGVAGAEAQPAGSERLSTVNVIPRTEAGEPTELSAEELREHYLGMSLEAALSEFPDIDEKHRRTATRFLKKRDIETIRDALIKGSWNFGSNNGYIRNSVRDAVQQFITDKLPGVEWHSCPIAVNDVDMPFIASVARDLRDLSATVLPDFSGSQIGPSGGRLTIQDLFDMSIDDLTVYFAHRYRDQVRGANTEEEREAGARAIARVAAQSDAIALRDRIHAYAIDFLHARQQLTSERPHASTTQPDAGTAL